MKAFKLGEKRINEIVGVLFLLVGLFTLLSLLFFNPSDHTFYTSHPNEQFRNITGIVGVLFAHYLHFTFGLSSFSVPTLFLFWSFCFFLQKVPRKKLVEIIGIIISIVAVSGLFSLLASESWKIRMGGVLGYFISENLEKYFGVAG